VLFLIGAWVRDAELEEPREQKLSLRYVLQCVERLLATSPSRSGKVRAFTFESQSKKSLDQDRYN
jgi:hypothetical protein